MSRRARVIVLGPEGQVTLRPRRAGNIEPNGSYNIFWPIRAGNIYCEPKGSSNSFRPRRAGNI